MIWLLLSGPPQIGTIHPAHDIGKAVEVIDLANAVALRIPIDGGERDRQRATKSRRTIRIQVPERLPAKRKPGGQFRPAFERGWRLAQIPRERLQPISLIAPL